MLQILRQCLLKFMHINIKMIKKMPNQKLKGLRIDKLFSQSPEAKARRKMHRAEKRANARRERQRAILRGESVDHATPLSLITSSSSEDENTYKGELI